MVRGRSSDAGTADVERLLAELPEMKLVGLLHGATNYTFLASLNPYPPAGLRVVYKPARGESPLWDFQAGTLYQREVAAYTLSKELGWPRIPPTVEREKGPRSSRSICRRPPPPPPLITKLNGQLGISRCCIV